MLFKLTLIRSGLWKLYIEDTICFGQQNISCLDVPTNYSNGVVELPILCYGYKLILIIMQNIL